MVLRGLDVKCVVDVDGGLDVDDDVDVDLDVDGGVDVDLDVEDGVDVEARLSNKEVMPDDRAEGTISSSISIA